LICRYRHKLVPIFLTCRVELVYNNSMYKLLRIHFGVSKSYYLDFELLDSPITKLWLERMECRNQWSMNNPDRFYGFNSYSIEENTALKEINQCIDTINSHQPIIERKLTTVGDQDTLNYLHNIFEKYHGMLDQQDHAWWMSAPKPVQQALAKLNIAVHRCESVNRNSQPRFVCTWWGMPKVKQLSQQLIEQHGQLGVKFGGVYLNYVEIGKTLLELAVDNDRYVADEMFKPFDYYSADFVVYFYNSSQQDLDYQQQLVNDYFLTHRHFFESHRILSLDDYRTQQWKFKVAQLLPNYYETDILENIKNNQYIHTVELI